ncbi:MAG: DMT family transporter [Pelagibacteraceae bacterium]|nr:DMT family transporter [Pelagibacteraceae bacterium]
MDNNVLKYFKNISGSLFVFAGALLISFSSIFVASVNLEPTVSAFYRVFIGCITLCFYYFLKERKSPFRRNISSYLYIAAVIFVLDLWFWHRSIIYIGPGLSTLLASLQVLIIPFLSYLIFKEVINRQQILAVVIAVIGLFICLSDSWQLAGSQYKLGIFFGLLTALAYSGYTISLKKASVHQKQLTNPIHNLLIISLLASILLAFIILLEGRSFNINSSSDFLRMLCYGVISHVFGWFFILKGMQKISAISVGVILIAQPILSFIWDVLFFSRKISIVEITGICIVIAALFICAKTETVNQNNTIKQS